MIAGNFRNLVAVSQRFSLVRREGVSHEHGYGISDISNISKLSDCEVWWSLAETD